MSQPTYDELRVMLGTFSDMFDSEESDPVVVSGRAMLARLRTCEGCEYGDVKSCGVSCRWSKMVPSTCHAYLSEDA